MAAKDNLLKFIEFQGIKKSEFYKTTGLSNGFLDKNANISSDKIEIIISVYPNINLHWLITGTGDMLIADAIEKQSKAEVVYINDPRDAELIVSNRETIDTQRKLIASLESRISELEKSSRSKRSIDTGLRSVPAVDSNYTNQSGAKPK